MRAFVFLVSAVLVLLALAACTTNDGTILLVNKAKEPISRVLVTVCGQTIEVKNIQPTESAQGSYIVKSDSQYDITVEFQSGKRLQKEVGYVTNGIDFHDEITITDTDIEIEANHVPAARVVGATGKAP